MPSSVAAGSAGLGAAGAGLSCSPCPWHRRVLPGWKPFVVSALVSCNWEMIVCLHTKWFSRHIMRHNHSVSFLGDYFLSH